MYIGALMPPRPIRPMKSPCPIHKGQGAPSVEIARPRPVISAPQMTVHRVPTLSASRPIKMPPTPEPSQTSAVASAGMERMPLTSAAMSLSATAAIHATPNAISMVKRAAMGTDNDSFDAVEEGCHGDGPRPFGFDGRSGRLQHQAGVRLVNLLAGRRCFDHPYGRGSALPAALRQNARWAPLGKFPFRAR